MRANDRGSRLAPTGRACWLAGPLTAKSAELRGLTAQLFVLAFDELNFISSTHRSLWITRREWRFPLLPLHSCLLAFTGFCLITAR
jgi:hypothetical protein